MPIKRKSPKAAKTTKSRSVIGKRITIVAVIAALVAGVYGFKQTNVGAQVGRAIVQSRCEAGAFIAHSDTAGKVAADSIATDSVAGTNDAADPVQPDVIGPNLVPNSELEQPYIASSSGTPPSWQHNVFGENDSTFSVVAGHDSATALRTQITKYSSGDADWYYLPKPVEGGKYYMYTDYYRSNVSTRAVLQLGSGRGDTQYINLKNAGPSDNWNKYQATFFVPNGVTQATVFHPLASEGFLELDDFSFTRAQPQGFSEPMVSVTFDDGWSSIATNALPLMKQYGIVSTQYIISGYVGQVKDYVTPKQVYALRNAGNEIASHTVNHADLTKLDQAKMVYELERSKKDLTKCFDDVTNYATPYGTYSTETTAAIKQFYQTARSTDAGFNTIDNMNPYGLLVQNISADTTEAQIKDWLSIAKQNKTWLILVYHQIDSDSSTYARKPADLEKDFKAIKNSGISVKTVKQAYSELKWQTKGKKQP